MQGGLSLKKSFKRRALELLFHIIAILSLSYYTIYTFVISAGVDEAFATFSVLIYWSIYLLIAGFLAPKKKDYSFYHVTDFSFYWNHFNF